MSIEKLITENMDALNKNTAMLSEVLASLKANTVSLDRINEGREQAIEQLTASDKETKKASPKKTAAKKAAAEKEEPETEPKAESKEEAKADAWNPDLSDDGIKGAVRPYLVNGDTDERKTAMENVLAILSHLGHNAVTETAGKTHPSTDEEKRQMLFYVARFAAGLPVDFKADYDFDADPLTQAVPEEAEEEDNGIGV